MITKTAVKLHNSWLLLKIKNDQKKKNRKKNPNQTNKTRELFSVFSIVVCWEKCWILYIYAETLHHTKAPYFDQSAWNLFLKQKIPVYTLNFWFHGGKSMLLLNSNRKKNVTCNSKLSVLKKRPLPFFFQNYKHK